jgi:hypothetical protein
METGNKKIERILEIETIKVGNTYHDEVLQCKNVAEEQKEMYIEMLKRMNRAVIFGHNVDKSRLKLEYK